VSPRGTLWDRWIALLLLFYPRAFRSRFGADLAAQYGMPRAKRFRSGLSAARDLVAAGLGARTDDLRSRGSLRSAGGALEAFALDLRHTLRGLGRRPLYAATVTATLALAAALNAAVFGILDATLLRPLPYRDADAIVSIGSRWTGYEHAAVSIPEYLDYRARARTLESIAAYVGASFNLSDDGRGPEWLAGARVSASLFDVMGVQAALGRTFTSAEDRPGAPPVVILSHGLWLRRFGGSPSAIGATVRFDSGSREIIGVMPPAFRFPNADTELWLPISINVAVPGPRGNHNRFVVGRVGPGSSIADVAREMSLIGAQLQQEHPQNYQDGSGWGVSVQPLRQRVFGEFRTALVLLMIAVSFVMLIAGTNVANLMVARISERQRDLAMRAALGAPRARLVRQGLIEGLLLGGTGGVLGLVLGGLLVRTFATELPDGLPLPASLLGLLSDARLAVFALTRTGGVGAAAALATTARALRGDQGLTIGGRRSTSDRRTQRLRGVLTVVQVALAAMLLVGGGVALRNFVRLMHVDPGLTIDGVTTARITALTRYASRTELASFLEQVTTAVSEAPGVSYAGITSILPLTGDTNDWGFIVEGREPAGDVRFRHEQLRAVGGAYFQTLGIRLAGGRVFDSRDSADRPQVAIVSELMARRYWGSESSLGKRLRFGGSDPSGPWTTIVGVVADIRDGGLNAGFEPMLYVPATQFPERSMTVVARLQPGVRNSRVIADAIRRVEPSQPAFAVRSMSDWVERGLARPRFGVALLALFAGLATVLAGVGIYGVMAFVVTLRTREIGVRLALGAQPGSLLRMVLRHSLTLAGVGLAAGIAAGMAMAKALEATFAGARAFDLSVGGSVAAVVLTVAIAAAYLPARRAMRVDPVEALRGE